MSETMDQIVAALRGHAKWVRNYATSPATYHRPSCSAETFDAAADEIERLRSALKPFAECDPTDEKEVDYLVSKPGAVAAARNALNDEQTGEAKP